MPALSARSARHAKPVAEPVEESVEHFRVSFLQRVATNQQSRFNSCFTRVSQGVRADTVASIRAGAPAVVRASFRDSAADYTLQPIVVLDPGHGHETPGSPYGYDTGAIRDKVIEARVVDAIAEKLKDALEERGTQVVETRPSLSEGIALSQRYRFKDQDRILQWRAELSYELAQKFPERPVLFLSLHANSSPTTRAKGAEIFYYENAGSRSPSAAFARSLSAHYKLPSGSRVMSENFGVLRCQRESTPAVLLELGYLSNPGDRAILKNALHDEGRAEKIADMIADGISAYVEERREQQSPKPPIMIADSGMNPRL